MSNYGKSPRKKCSKCGKERFLSRDFYMSNSNKHADGRIGVCKPCIFKSMEAKSLEELKSDKYIDIVKDTLLDMNRPYIHNDWLSAIEQAKNSEREIHPSRVIGIYLKNINFNHKDKNWLDSEFAGEEIFEETVNEGNEPPSDKEETKVQHEIELNTQNEKDVLRLLGYDPFEYESEKDRSNLFNKLVDYLDESTLEDGFKLSSVIEIVRTFNQIDKINAAISKNMSDMKNFSKNTGNITSLINAKDKMLKSALDVAKENGISVKHATNKSKGAGTLSGILKQLQEYDIDEAETNLFDVKTAKGIRQIADISNRSIYNQLAFDENDMTSMLRNQRELIEEYLNKSEKFEEEARQLRVELAEKNEEIKLLNEKFRVSMNN